MVKIAEDIVSIINLVQRCLIYFRRKRTPTVSPSLAPLRHKPYTCVHPRKKKSLAHFDLSVLTENCPPPRVFSSVCTKARLRDFLTVQSIVAFVPCTERHHVSVKTSNFCSSGSTCISIRNRSIESEEHFQRRRTS